MRDYGIVSPKFWIGDTGKRLRGDANAQVLAVYLMTSPHAHATGVYHCPVLYMAHETGLSIEGASKALRRLIEESFCEYEEASETIFVKNMATHQIAEQLDPKDKRIPWLKKELEKMPKALKTRFLCVYGVAYHLVEKPRPSEAPSKALRSQDQDQDQDKSTTASSTPARKRVPRETDPAWLLDFKLAYPTRAGDQGWRKAVKAANARITEGHTTQEFIDGAKRYAAYCAAQGKVGTEFVKQAATFLGPDKPFLEAWTVPPAKGAPPANWREDPRFKHAV